jgi:hypothetical protein
MACRHSNHSTPGIGGVRERRTGLFSASGTLELTSAGSGSPSPLSEARPFVPSELYNSLALLVGEDTPGFLTPGQSFSGTMTDSDWEPLDGVAVTVAHNSWFTADVPALLTDPNISETPIVGLAWGIFSLDSGEGDYYQGSYALLLGGAESGALAIDPSCGPSPALGAAAGSLLGVGTEVRAAIKDLTDTGDFTAGPAPATGDFQTIGDSGTLAVSAAGCLGQEVARFSVNSVREGG